MLMTCSDRFQRDISERKKSWQMINDICARANVSVTIDCIHHDANTTNDFGKF